MILLYLGRQHFGIVVLAASTERYNAVLHRDRAYKAHDTPIGATLSDIGRVFCLYQLRRSFARHLSGMSACAACKVYGLQQVGTGTARQPLAIILPRDVTLLLKSRGPRGNPRQRIEGVGGSWSPPSPLVRRGATLLLAGMDEFAATRRTCGTYLAGARLKYGRVKNDLAREGCMHAAIREQMIRRMGCNMITASRFWFRSMSSCPPAPVAASNV